MLTGDSAIKVFHIGGMLIMGTVEGDYLVSPRVLDLQPRGNQLQVRLFQLAGLPTRITVGMAAFSYSVQEQSVLDAYRENVTGLTLAKTIPGNVLPMVGRKQ